MENLVLSVIILCVIFAGITPKKDKLPPKNENPREIIKFDLQKNSDCFFTEKIETETFYEEFQTVYKSDSSLETGKEKLYRKGARGEKTVTYRVTYKNGEEYAREIISSKITEKTDEIILIGSKPSTKSTGIFYYPLDYVYITSPYGKRILNGVEDFHLGIDLRASVGTPVYASDGGVVIELSNPHWSYGKLIVIDHENGYRTYYAHLSEIKVSPGERVYQGQVIGKSGETGNVTGPHLHFEIRKKADDGIFYTFNPQNKLQSKK